MIEVNEALTLRTAHLARLDLSEQEAKTFTSQLGDILKYVEQLQGVNTAGVEPLFSPAELDPEPRAMREDEARPSPVNAEGRPKVLGSAPETFQDGFKVPPIL